MGPVGEASQKYVSPWYIHLSKAQSLDLLGRVTGCLDCGIDLSRADFFAKWNPIVGFAVLDPSEIYPRFAIYADKARMGDVNRVVDDPDNHQLIALASRQRAQMIECGGGCEGDRTSCAARR